MPPAVPPHPAIQGAPNETVHNNARFTMRAKGRREECESPEFIRILSEYSIGNVNIERVKPVANLSTSGYRHSVSGTIARKIRFFAPKLYAAIKACGATACRLVDLDADWRLAR
jgi:hypothetical protein